LTRAEKYPIIFIMKPMEIGRYGIDWNKNPEDLTKKDYETILTETTKIIEKGDYSNIIESSSAFYDRGIIYLKKKDYQKALSDFTESINLEKDFPSSYYNRGCCYYYLKNCNKALNDFKMTIKLYPDHEKAKTWIEIIKQETKIN
jgi:tetratricopeptide (TPR) repeat protein